jgi:hypothetical protein
MLQQSQYFRRYDYFQVKNTFKFNVQKQGTGFFDDFWYECTYITAQRAPILRRRPAWPTISTIMASGRRGTPPWPQTNRIP